MFVIKLRKGTWTNELGLLGSWHTNYMKWNLTSFYQLAKSHQYKKRPSKILLTNLIDDGHFYGETKELSRLWDWNARRTAIYKLDRELRDKVTRYRRRCEDGWVIGSRTCVIGGSGGSCLKRILTLQIINGDPLDKAKQWRENFKPQDELPRQHIERPISAKDQIWPTKIAKEWQGKEAEKEPEVIIWPRLLQLTRELLILYLFNPPSLRKLEVEAVQEHWNPGRDCNHRDSDIRSPFPDARSQIIFRKLDIHGRIIKANW